MDAEVPSSGDQKCDANIGHVAGRPAKGTWVGLQEFSGTSRCLSVLLWDRRLQLPPAPGLDPPNQALTVTLSVNPVCQCGRRPPSNLIRFYNANVGAV